MGGLKERTRKAIEDACKVLGLDPTPALKMLETLPERFTPRTLSAVAIALAYPRLEQERICYACGIPFTSWLRRAIRELGLPNQKKLRLLKSLSEFARLRALERTSITEALARLGYREHDTGTRWLKRLARQPIRPDWLEGLDPSAYPHLWPARCPRCGGQAWATVPREAWVICRRCGVFVIPAGTGEWGEFVGKLMR